MPELPEVETIRRALEPALQGRKIVNVTAHRKGLRVPFPARMRERLEGQGIIACRRRAKYILIDLGGGETLVLHLGMSGQVILHHLGGSAYKARKHDHLVIDFDNGLRLVFNDARRFGMALLIAREELENHEAFRRMGPEPLESSFDAKALAAALAGRKTSIKAALMDQRIVAGLGNIYVCEALFHAGISPDRKAGTVQGDRARKLVKAIRDVLKRAIKAGGSTLKDYRRTDGELGYFQHRFAVYDREGQACSGCSCNISKTGGIRRKTQAGRSTFYCPRKQT